MDMAVPLTLVLMACAFTTYTQGSNSLQLTSSPATASPGQPFTLMCSGSSGRSRAWYWRNDMVFRLRYVSDTQCAVDVSQPTIFRHLTGRVNVTCSYNQYNVTLRILTSIDNGSVWWCVDTERAQESNRWTIHVNVMTMSSTTTTAATTGATATSSTSATTTTTTTTHKFDISSSTSLQEGVSPADHGANEKPTSGDVCPLYKDAPNVVYIAVGAAVGGVVVGCVITIIVVIVWMRRRNTSTEDNATAPNIYASPSHYEDMEHQYGKVDRQYVNTVEVRGTDSLYAVNTEVQAGNAAYYNTTGQHQHPDGL